MTSTDGPLTFEVLGTGRTISLHDHQTVVAGYTGRDEAAVRHHIEELAAIGVPEPPTVPMFYPMDSSTVSTATGIRVAGSNTSGEVEPVLVRHHGGWFLGLGSDHTDRDLETRDIAESKQACPKPVASSVIAVPDWAELDWDTIRMLSRVDGTPYQDGALSGLRRPEQLTALLVERGADEGRDLVCFAGTLPLLDGRFVAGTVWELTLTLPDGRTISHRYETKGL